MKKLFAITIKRKEFLMKLKKIIVFACIFLCAAILSGCELKFGTNPKVDPKTVVAKPTRLCFTGELDVSYEDFSKEYLFYMNANDMDEETSDAELCRQLRDSIITNIIYDKIMLLKAKEFGRDTLTDEETKAVQDEYDNEIENQIATFGENADYSDFPEGTEITDEMKKERGEQEFNKMLESCGMVREDIYGWIKNYYISQKMVNYYVDKVDKTESEDMLNEYIEEIKSIYETDPVTYEQGSYSTFWIPEGSRYIKHVLLGFDEETQAAIKKYRDEDNDLAADQLREEKAAELADKQAEVEKALDDGDKWEDIILQYSADATGSSAYPDGYLVVPNGGSYVEEFQEAAFVPENVGDRTVCISDYGVHIMIYASKAEVSEEQRNDILEYLSYNIAQNNLAEEMNKWYEEYAFDIDKEALRLETADSSN